jgi:histidyl-tRNA synthetase
MNKNFQSPRGTYDILPSEVAAWRFIEKTFREVTARYNYGEIRTPLFESTELFLRATGEASDIVVTKQMYTFTALDEQSYTLRPEGTAGTLRAYIEAHLSERGPVTKLCYLGPMFRYEAVQAGRQRQFHQAGIELLGASGPESDAEVLALAADFLRALGIEATLHLNTLGTPASRAGYLDELRTFLSARRDSLSEDSQRRLVTNPLRIFDSKDERDRAAIIEAPRLLDYLRANDEESTAHFTRLCGYLDDLGLPYEVDPLLVRGLDYYTHTAFEFVSDKLGAQSTVLAGGRYDKLIEELGGAPTPGIGWGAGLERLLLVQEASNVPVEAAPRLTAFLVTMGDNARTAGVKILRQLRDAGISADSDFVGRSVKQQMREANRQNARFALLLGDDELNEGTIAVKDLESHDQTNMSMVAAIAKLQSFNADAAVAKYFSESN